MSVINLDQLVIERNATGAITKNLPGKQISLQSTGTVIVTPALAETVLRRLVEAVANHPDDYEHFIPEVVKCDPIFNLSDIPIMVDVHISDVIEIR